MPAELRKNFVKCVVIQRPELYEVNDMSTWNEQWDRVNRYYSRFKRINDGCDGHGDPSDYFFDDMWAFFQNCYHLKDWLKKDKFISSKIRKPVEYYITKTESLAICADLANSLKHMKFSSDNNHKPRTGKEPKRASRSMSVNGGSPVVTLKANIEHKGRIIDAFDLATECMAAWRAYLP